MDVRSITVFFHVGYLNQWHVIDRVMDRRDITVIAIIDARLTST